MKKIIVLISCISFGTCFAQNNTGVNKIKIEKQNPEPYTVVDENAEFPGGYQALYQYISKNIIYPAAARDSGITGTCYLKFVVTETGYVNNIEIVKGVNKCSDCDKETIRVAQSMPQWKPAKVKDKNVKCFIMLPVKFKMS